MPAWYIEPRDPLIVRDGRPFGPDPGARARSLAFPMPSTITGGLRNRAGLDAKNGVFERGAIDRVLRIAVRGPLLAALTADGAFSEWLPPAPADALLLPGAINTEARIVRLAPLEKSAETDFAPPEDGADLALVGPAVAINEKPFGRPPQFWHWTIFAQWLLDPAHEQFSRSLPAAELGIAGPARETRTHVSIQPGTQTAEEGRLFQTSGLEFTATDQTRLALVIESEADLKHFSSGGFAPLGGERRLMAWRPGVPALPSCPPAIREQIVNQRACRVCLLTPAHFAAGYRPAWLLAERHGVQATLVAALVQRPQVISGWDMQLGRPKATRRLAPAGSVYFLKLPEAKDARDDAVNAWIDAIWMQNISDDQPGDAERDRRDGFGLAVLGAWDGALTIMEVLE